MWWFKKDSGGGGANGLRIVLSTGQVVQFEAITWDLGVYPPEGKGISEWLAGELRRCIAEQRGGITEITLAEYNQLLDSKKNNPNGLKPPQREEWKATHRPEGNITTLSQFQTSPQNIPPGDAAGPAGKTVPINPPPGGPPIPAANPLPTVPPRPTATRKAQTP